MAKGDLLLITPCLLGLVSAMFFGAHLCEAADVGPPLPQDDFFNAVNYKWLKATELPSNNFEVLENRTMETAKMILKEASQKVRDGKNGASHLEQSVGAYYLSGMDLDARRAQGIQPLKPLFEALTTVRNKGQLAGLLSRKGFHTFYHLEVARISRQKKRLIFHFNNFLVPGITRLDHDVALCNVPNPPQPEQCSIILNVTRHSVATLFQYLGDSPMAAMENTQHVLNSVTSLTDIELISTQIEGYDDLTEFTSAQLRSTAPDIDFGAFFRALGAPPMFAALPRYVEVVNSWSKGVSTPEFLAFMRYRIAVSVLHHLDDNITDLFLGKTPSEEKVFQNLITNEPIMSMALGQLFSRKLLPQKTYAMVEKFVHAIRGALKPLIEGLTWMQDATKAEALDKVEKFRVYIGAPKLDAIPKSLKLSVDSYLGNTLLLKEFKMAQDLDGLVKETVEDEWPESRTPLGVNAFYATLLNQIYINAAILQPPFFQANAVDEVNFGALGMVIGHEMGHAFDTTGRLYDSEGVKRNWWTADDEKDYLALAEKLKSQFKKYRYFGQPVDYNKTLGEAIADHAGLALAYSAWNRTQATGGLPLPQNCKRKRTPKAWRRYSSSQRFFLSNARMWRTKDNNESATERLAKAHPPAIFRANGPSSNFEPFYEAFGVQPRHKMYRALATRFVLW